MLPQARDDSPGLPVIDLSLARSGATWLDHLAAQLDWAATEFGFFYVIGHHVDQQLIDRMARLSREFFDWPVSRKLELHMKLGGAAWRGYFPVGGELTSGRPDLKEGLYLGEELDASDPRVTARWPLHGKNLFPDIPGFAQTVIEYLGALASLSQELLELLGRGLRLGEGYFRRHYTARPTQLLRLFSYPPGSEALRERCYGVGEHTDYGLLTLLYQDEVGGLEVNHDGGWLDVPYLPGTFVVNVGDMLERLTAGRYRSALHRVVNRAARTRLSIPYFFDPAFDARLAPLEGLASTSPRRGVVERWDGIDLAELAGTYGEYLMSKVSRVFPELSGKLK